MKKTRYYLGGGVYADFQRDHIELTSENSMMPFVDVIHLDRKTLAAFERYREKVKNRNNGEKS